MGIQFAGNDAKPKLQPKNRRKPSRIIAIAMIPQFGKNSFLREAIDHLGRNKACIDAVEE